jgi:hypothetical protein
LARQDLETAAYFPGGQLYSNSVSINLSKMRGRERERDIYICHQLKPSTIAYSKGPRIEVSSLTPHKTMRVCGTFFLNGLVHPKKKP